MSIFSFFSPLYPLIIFMVISFSLISIIKLLFYLPKKIIEKSKSFLIRFVKIADLRNQQKYIICYNDYPLSDLPIPTPELTQIKLPPHKQHLAQREYTLPSIYTVIAQNLLYSPWHNIFLTPSRKIIVDSIGTMRDKGGFNCRKIYSNQVKTLPGCYTIIRSSTATHSNNYYHTIVDNLPRLWLIQKTLQDWNQLIKILFSSPPTSIEDFFLSKLLPTQFKIDIEVVDLQFLYQIETLVLPSIMTRPGVGYLPSEYLQFFQDRVTPHRPPKQNSRIFITRKHTTSRRIKNQEQFDSLLQQYGFKEYALEYLSFEEKIELFYDTECVIGAYGAGLTNIIFSPHLSVIELFPTPYIIPHYYFLAKSLRHHYQCWCGQASEINVPSFEVNVSAIAEMLKILD